MEREKAGNEVLSDAEFESAVDEGIEHAIDEIEKTVKEDTKKAGKAGIEAALLEKVKKAHSSHLDLS